MKRIGGDGTRTVWSCRLESPYLLVESLGGEPFVALLCAFDRLGITQRASVARSLIAQGCRRLLVLADDAAAWQAEVEHASAERFAGFVVPPGQEVAVSTFTTDRIADAVTAFLDAPDDGPVLARHLALSCCRDARVVEDLERAIGAAFRGEVLPPVMTPQAGIGAPAGGPAPTSGDDGRALLGTPGRFGAVGRLVDAYGRSVSVRRDVELVHRRDRWMLQSWLGDHEVLLDIRPLEAGSVATTWSAHHPRLGALQGFLSVFEGTVISTFASSDGKHRGAEAYQRIDAERFQVDGSLFAGPVLMGAWHLALRRRAGGSRAPERPGLAGRSLRRGS